MEKGSGDMAVPKLFYFPNSGSGQDHATGRRARAWTTLEIPLLLLVTTGLGEVEGVAIEGYYRICSRSGCFCGPSNWLWETLMLLCMPTTTLRSSLSVAYGSWLKIMSMCSTGVLTVITLLGQQILSHKN